jgi:predicted DNA-binding protein with PD1-like motif
MERTTLQRSYLVSWIAILGSRTARKVLLIAFSALSIGFVTGAVGQTDATQWVSPSHPIATGKAPSMKVQLISENGKQKTYAVIFSKGVEAFSGLTDFARQYNVTAAHFTAIGALNGADLAWFDPSRKMYKPISIQGQVEVLSMIGDIAIYKGKPAVHTHMVVGFPDGSTRGGHVLEAHVNPTLEVMVTVEPNAMHKRLDPATDLTLIDPTLIE